MAIINGLVRGVITGGSHLAEGGRVHVQLRALAGSGTVWAPVCRAFGAGGTIGGAVWVAFENGDPDHPVVVGPAE